MGTGEVCALTHDLFYKASEWLHHCAIEASTYGLCHCFSLHIARKILEMTQCNIVLIICVHNLCGNAQNGTGTLMVFARAITV